MMKEGLAVGRHRVADVLIGSDRRSLRKQGWAICRCGEPVLAKQGTQFGWVALLCRRRFCAFCQKVRANMTAARLAAFGESRMERGFQLAAVTLTQLKNGRESAKSAKERVIRSFSRLCKKNLSVGRKFAAVCHGGVRCLETTHEPDGKNRGFHMHLHILVELKRGVSYGEFTRVLMECWGEVSPGMASIAQHVRPVKEGEDNAFFETCKYPLKPMAMSPAVLEEVALAFENARLVQGWGGWRSAIGEGKRILRERDKRERAPIRVAERGLDALFSEEPVTIYAHKGKDSERETYDVQSFRESIVRDPRSLAQRERDQLEGVEPPALNTERIAWWVGLRERRQGKRSTGPPDATGPPGGEPVQGKFDWS